MRKEYNHKPFLENLLLGNREKCLDIAHGFVENETDIKVFYEQILTKALYEVGFLWENHKISIATEHLASAIAENVINDFYLKLIRTVAVGKTAVVCNVKNEFHQLGTRLVSDVFEMNGWNAHILGANTTTEDILSFLESAKPDILAISMTLDFNLPLLLKMLNAIKEEYPEQAIIIGGQAFTQNTFDMAIDYYNVHVIKNLPELEAFIKKINE